MTRPSGKQFPGTSLCQEERNCISQTLRTSSSSPRSPQGPHPDHPSGPPPRHCHPPRLFSHPLTRGRVRNFEGSLPPSQPQVGGILNRHWHAWKLCGADEWTVAVLQQRYHIPFHHLPPMSLVLRELSSCAPGLDRAEVLQEKVSKMLQKGVVEPVDQLSPGFCSQLFLIEKVTDGGMEARRRFINIEQIRHSDKVPYGDGSVCSWIDSAWGLDVLHQPGRCVLSDSCPSGISSESLLLSRGTCLSVPCIVLQPVHGP